MALDALLPGHKSQENSGSSPPVDKSLSGPIPDKGNKVASELDKAHEGEAPPHGIAPEKAAPASAPSPPQMIHHLLMDADFDGQ